MILIIGEHIQKFDTDSELVLAYLDSREILFLELEFPTKKRSLINDLLPFALEEHLLTHVNDNRFEYTINKKGLVEAIVINKGVYDEFLSRIRQESPKIDIIYPDIFLVPHKEGKTVVFCFHDRILVRTGLYSGFAVSSAYAYSFLDSLVGANFEIYSEAGVEIPEKYREYFVGETSFEDFLEIDITNDLYFYRGNVRLPSKFAGMGFDWQSIMNRLRLFYYTNTVVAITLGLFVGSSIIYSGLKYFELYTMGVGLEEKYLELAIALQVDVADLPSEVEDKYFQYKLAEARLDEFAFRTFMKILTVIRECKSCSFQRIDLSGSIIELVIENRDAKNTITTDLVVIPGVKVDTTDGIYRITYYKEKDSPNSTGR